jgi:hypothetical protein
MSQRLMRLEERELKRSGHERDAIENEEDNTDIQPTQPQFNNNENNPDNTHYNPHNAHNTNYQPNNSHSNVTKSGEKQSFPFHHPTAHYDDNNNTANSAVTPSHKRLRV